MYKRQKHQFGVQLAARSSTGGV